MVPGHERCTRCLYLQRVCLCAQIPRIETATRVLIIRHHREKYRSSNTGRLAHQALVNSELVDHGEPGHPTVIPPLMEGSWIVFPGGEGPVGVPVPPPTQIIVLDATWSQARKMFHKLDALRGLPLLRLPDAPMPAARLRESPGEGRVSTIEAIARALRLLEGDGPANPLEALFDLAVSRAVATGRSLDS